MISLFIFLGGRMSKGSWGRSWTEQKLDAFAGSGKRAFPNKEEQTFPLFDITPEEENIYQGAAERVIRIKQRGFDHYYFIENDNASRNELENILSSVKKEKKLDLHFCDGDANEYIYNLADTMKKNKKFCSLTLLDPFGMQVNWDSIVQLKDTRTDLWILIPSGIIINRLLDKNGKLKNIDKLVAFFGLSEHEIREYFYEQDNNPHGLFDVDNEIQKTSMPIQKISELYIQQLKTIFKKVTPKPLEMKNSRNVPLFHFAFASNNPTALKIANDIIGKERK
jgi:three-Cys-motif partner protein